MGCSGPSQECQDHQLFAAASFLPPQGTISRPTTLGALDPSISGVRRQGSVCEGECHLSTTLRLESCLAVSNLPCAVLFPLPGPIHLPGRARLADVHTLPPSS